jgi:hypothetical protein
VVLVGYDNNQGFWVARNSWVSGTCLTGCCLSCCGLHCVKTSDCCQHHNCHDRMPLVLSRHLAVLHRAAVASCLPVLPDVAACDTCCVAVSLLGA